MKIAVDFDNTLADTTGVLTRITNLKHGTEYTKDSIVEWNFWHKVGIEDTFWAIYNLMDSPEHGGINLRRALPPVDPLACGIVKTLIKQGHDVHILTANRPEARDSIEAWLFGHGLDPHVELTGRVSPVEKVKLDYDLFIDDAPHMVPAMSEVPGKTLILLDQPWNRNEDISGENVWRAGDWLEVLAILRAMGAVK